MTSGEGGCVVIRVETIECSDGARRVAASGADSVAMVSLTASATLMLMHSDSSVIVDGASGGFGEPAVDWMSGRAGGFAGGSVTVCA